MTEEEFKETVKMIVAMDGMPNEMKTKTIVDAAIRMAKEREHKIFNKLTIRFNEAVNEKY